MTNKTGNCREFLFRALMFEAEADSFRNAGIRVGADIAKSEGPLLMERLEPFGIARRNQALQMARLYAIVFCFENEVRDLIRERLEEQLGQDWWEAGVPQKVKNAALSIQKQALKDSWLDGSKDDLLGFCEFGCLADIMIGKWEFFEDIIPSQHWLKQRMDELEKARNFIAHNRMLMPAEFERVYMYVADWNKVVGL